MKKIQGPQIHTIVHTETQDGKSLLDAHFSHGTAKVIRSICHVIDNRLNKVTSASELVEALSSLGGLQNCGTQLICFDSDVSRALEELSNRLDDVGDKLKEYFNRANKINFFPETDSDSGDKFQIHVKAYSKVSLGLRMKIDLGQGTVHVCTNYGGEGEDSVFQEAEGGENESGGDFDDMIDADDVDDVFATTTTSIGGLDDDDDDDDEDDVLVISDTDESQGDINKKELQSTNGVIDYCSTDMVTGVKVEKFMPLGEVLSTNETAKRKLKNVVGEDTARANRKDLLSRGIRVLKSEGYNSLGIRQGMDETVPEFEVARGFRVPTRFTKTRGWARRPDRGKMYGEKYIGLYKEELLESSPVM